MKKNDKVTLNAPLKEEYSDTMLPAGHELMVWKASRDGTLRCSYKSPRHGQSNSITVKASMVTPLARNCQMPKPGDLFLATWGYNQTNCDFYQVTSIKNKSVEIRPIHGKNLSYDANCFQGTVTPEPGNFTGAPQLKLVRFDAEDRPYFKVASYAVARPAVAGEVYNYSDGN